MSYKKDGYIIVKTSLGDHLKSLRQRFIDIFNKISIANGLDSIQDDQGVIDLYNSKHRDLWVGAYTQMRYLPEVGCLGGHSELLNAARQAGVKEPCLAARLIVRADMPEDDEWRFPPHQDFPYNQGSANSVTIWIPFQDITTDIGPLEVIPGSHRQGAFKHEQGIYKGENPDPGYRDVCINTDSILCFSQLLLHKSGRNGSKDKIRFSAQFRYNDLADKEFAKRAYRFVRSDTEKMPQVKFNTKVFD